MSGLHRLSIFIILWLASIDAFAIIAYYPSTFENLGFTVPYTMPPSIYPSFNDLYVISGTMTSTGPVVTMRGDGGFYKSGTILVKNGTAITGNPRGIYILGIGNSVVVEQGGIVGSSQAAIEVAGSNSTVNCSGTLGGAIIASYYQTGGSNNILNMLGSSSTTTNIRCDAGELAVNINDAASIGGVVGNGLVRVVSNTTANSFGGINLPASGCSYTNNNSGINPFGTFLMGPNATVVFNSTNTTANPFSGTIQVGSGSNIYYYRGLLTNPITATSGTANFLVQTAVSFTQNQTFTGINVITPLGFPNTGNGVYSTVYTQNGASTGATYLLVNEYALYVINQGFSLAPTSGADIVTNGFLMVKGTFSQPSAPVINGGTTLISGIGNLSGNYRGTQSTGKLYIGVPSAMAPAFPGAASSSYSTSGNLSDFALIQVDSPSGGSIFTLNNTISGVRNINVMVNNTMNMANNSALTGIATSFNVFGTVNFNSTNTGATALSIGGLVINPGGVFNVNQNLTGPTGSGNGTFISGGAMNIASGMTYTNNAYISQSGGLIAGPGTLTNNSLYVIYGGNLTAILQNTGNWGTFASVTLPAGSQNSGTMSIYSGTNAALTLNNNFTNTGTINNSSIMNVNANLLGNGTINNNGRLSDTGAPNAILNLTGVVSANTINNTLYGVVNIYTALSGTGVLTNNNIVNVYSATLSQTNPFVNNNIVYFNGANTLSGPTVNNGTFFLNPNASLTVNSNGTIPAGTVTATAGTNTTFTVDKNFAFAGTMSNIQNIIINATRTMTLQSGASVSGFNDFAVNGNLVIGNGALFNINPGDNIHGNGNLDNFGQLNINGSNLTLGGNFYNHSSGVFSIYGVPTLNFGGAFTNDGSLITTFNESNSLPIINVGNPPTLTNGTIAIGYSGNYIANGFYPFINGPAPIPLSSIGAALLPPTNIYITNWALGTQGNSVGVQVTRIGFGDVATTPATKAIGYYMDSLGANNPSQAILDLLNGLQRITNPAELDAALLDIMPPDNVPIQTLAMVDMGFTAIQDHIFTLACRNNMLRRCDIAAGDDASVSNGVWIRPFGSSARQNTKENLIGYTARTNGVVGGFDNQVSSNLLLGLAGSYAKSTVTQQYSLSSISTIKSYNVMLYSSYKTEGAAYIDGVFSIGTNNFEGSRVIDFTTYYATANSKYSGQQYTAKIMASKNYRALKYFQFTPMALAQYGFLRQLPYTETGAGAFNRNVSPNNMNLFQLGVGSQLSMPFDEGKIMGIPAIYAMVLVDAQGGELITNTQFISGGPILTNSVQAGRLIGRLGMSVSYQLGDNVEVVGNYNIEMRSKYFANELFLNMRYVF